jgi:hypothetical protein
VAEQVQTAKALWAFVRGFVRELWPAALFLEVNQ